MKKQLVFVAMGIVLASSGAQSEETGFLESVHCVGGPYGLDLPKDARKLKSLGKLLREKVSEVERWDGYTATRKTLFFDGFEIGIIEFSNDPARLMVTYADISKPSWNRPSPFKLGRPVAEARMLLGPSAKDDDELRRTYGSESGSLDFQTASGVVVHVSYSCYSG